MEGFNSRFGNRIVTVYVGSVRQEFKLHEKVVCRKSDFFNRAFYGEFKENNGILELLEDDPKVFESFVAWVYAGGSLKRIDFTKEDEVHRIMSLYFFADKYVIKRLENTIIPMVYAATVKKNWVPPLALVQRVIDNTSPGDDMVKLPCNRVAWCLFDDTDNFWYQGDLGGWRTFIKENRAGDLAIQMLDSVFEGSLPFHASCRGTGPCERPKHSALEKSRGVQFPSKHYFKKAARK
ncbi:hypothetical protein QBC35DRAFT_451562 [Podospora australis]|uniref:BTB domain-containing protein n=1 Tax=Podospora australis TaxID=1536484 RepID=A0AAN6WVK9_9PEZI|nr:hypothetical protein QBC35DRAFT_451562 [Podospora australis]